MTADLSAQRTLATRLRELGLILAAVCLLTSQLTLLALVGKQADNPNWPYDSDFAQLYASAQAWHEFGPSHAYDAGAEGTAYVAASDGHGRGWTWPNAWEPGSLLIGIPLAGLPLASAFALWDAFQTVLIVAAAVIAARAAQGALRIGARATIVVGAITSCGTVATLLLGQWDGVPALGLAIAYSLWKRGQHDAVAALTLTMLFVNGKPHLAIGLLTFAACRSGLPALKGIASGGLLSVLIALALVGPEGVVGWLGTLRFDAGLPPSASLGILGLFEWLVPSSALLAPLFAIAACVSVGATAWLGRRSRVPGQLETSLTAATILSLLISPHLFGQDFAVLIPILVAQAATTHGRRLGWLAVLSAGGVLSLATEYQTVPFGSLRADPLVPLVLLLMVTVVLSREARGWFSTDDAQPAESGFPVHAIQRR